MNSKADASHTGEIVKRKGSRLPLPSVIFFFITDRLVGLFGERSGANGRNVDCIKDQWLDLVFSIWQHNNFDCIQWQHLL